MKVKGNLKTICTWNARIGMQSIGFHTQVLSSKELASTKCHLLSLRYLKQK